MLDATLRTNTPASYTTGLRTNWGAIWGGMFTFAAIWMVFEALAVAIFPDRASVGMQVWTVVLTIIAMYVAGIETGRLAGLTNRHDGLVHGIIMFGLSVVSTIVLATLATGVVIGAAVPRAGYVFAFGPGTEWAGFFALLLGWFAAMGGASSGVARQSLEVRRPAEPPIEMRPAA